MNDINLEEYFVLIPDGEIELRDDRIKQKWTVKIDSFLIAKFLITQDFYEKVINDNPSEFKGKDLPIENISWVEAVKFCNTLSSLNNLEECYFFKDEDENEIVFDKSKNGYRLPTEAEWEFSCKAGNDSIRYGKLDEIAWFKDNSNKETQVIGLKKPNDWGIYDMLGNVWEWCSDVYDETVYGSYRIIRGGGWNDEERGVMATNRRRSHPKSFKIDDLGFRIAKNNV